ncbi:MAG: hypothetical protein K6T85_12565 [Gorillibacterium sp.]|nr:hypothetical protein [Gorillibacterium sp.]
MNFAKLREMEKLCRGDARKIAAYTVAQRDYDETIKTMFPKESPIKFVDCPGESYVTDAENRATETGDADDIVRAALLRDRFDAYEGDKTAHLDLRTSVTALRAKLESGDKLTKSDVDKAWKLAKLNPSPDNIVLYGRYKREFENPSERTEPPAAPAKVTAEDVEAAKERAQRNPSNQNIAKFATLKRELEGSNTDESN